jgi:hypothetical protein
MTRSALPSTRAGVRTPPLRFASLILARLAGSFLEEAHTL